jgi:hypothetical protein
MRQGYYNLLHLLHRRGVTRAVGERVHEGGASASERSTLAESDARWEPRLVTTFIG